MILDAVLSQPALLQVPEIARSAEEIGFGALWSSETQHDPFLPGVLIAEHTSHIAFGTAVAISFARSPGTLAYTAWDLAKMSTGRFILGLGTQVKPHIVRRFGMPWPDSVVGKLREQIQAVRALWHSWQTGEELNYRGKHFKLTLMTPFFNPGPIDQPQIPIYIAGVNTGLAKLAGECADGFLVHPLHSARYLAEVILPAISRNARHNKRNPSDIQISVSVFYATTPVSYTHLTLPTTPYV
jgi:probable F420-dependent oxidoreductase